MANIECKCYYNFTCGYCLRNAPPYFFTPSSVMIRVSIGNDGAAICADCEQELDKHGNCTRCNYEQDMVGLYGDPQNERAL